MNSQENSLLSRVEDEIREGRNHTGYVSRDQEFGMYYKYNDKLLKVWGSILTYILEV